MLYSTPSKWLMQKHPPLWRCRTAAPDPALLPGIFDPFYRGAFDAGLPGADRCTQLRRPAAEPRASRPPTAPGARRRPGCYVADDATLDWLAAYAAAGGHLVLGPRTALRRPRGPGPRSRSQPAGSPSAAGVWYDEFSNLSGRPAGAGDARLTAEAAVRRRGHPMGGRRCTRGRRGARRLRPPALRPVGGGDHPRHTARPDHLRRHDPQPPHGPALFAMAASPTPGQWYGLPDGRDLHRRPHRTGGGCASCTTGPGRKSPFRHGPRCATCSPAPTTRRVRDCPSARGTYACCWRCPPEGLASRSSRAGGRGARWRPLR